MLYMLSLLYIHTLHSVTAGMTTADAPPRATSCCATCVQERHCYHFDTPRTRLPPFRQNEITIIELERDCYHLATSRLPSFGYIPTLRAVCNSFVNTPDMTTADAPPTSCCTTCVHEDYSHDVYMCILHSVTVIICMYIYVYVT